MFYDTQSNAHGLPHDPFKAIVAPRPIGWIGTKGRDGVNNLAPYSFFNAISDSPKLVMFSSSGKKDSQTNIEETGVFTCNLASYHLLHQMNASSVMVPSEVDEFVLAGLTAVPGQIVDAPYVEEAYAALECKAVEIHPLKGLDGVRSENTMIIGQVVGIHIREEALKEGRLDMALVRPLSRLGYLDYAHAGEVFPLARPKAET